MGGSALVVAFRWTRNSLAAPAPAAAAPKAVTLDRVDAFLALDKKGGWTLYAGKVDLGTGTDTALRQIVADELDLPMSQVAIVTGDTQLCPDQGKTWGSLTIQDAGVQIRNAAAVAHGALLAAASKKLGVQADSIQTTDGAVVAGDRRVPYVDLLGDGTLSLSLSVDHKKPPRTKDPKTFKVVGKPVSRDDVPEKVFAKFTYMQDFRVPRMLHGRAVHPPGIGATLQDVDESSLKKIPGVVKVVRQGNFLGVVAKTEWAAIKASRELKATWSKWEGLPDQSKLYEHVRATKVVSEDVTSNAGNTAAAFGAPGVRKLSATYDFAIQTHGSIGPSCAVAELKDGKLTSWSASQATHDLRKQLANLMGMKPEDVHCLYVEGAGCYGRNGHEDAAGEAALLARAVGKPVRVQWMREDEHGWDPKGPPTLVDLRAALDAQGNLTAWEGEFFIPQATGVQVPLTPATLAGVPPEKPGPEIAPGNIIRDSNIPYQLANVKTTCHRLESTPFRPSWIRSPGRMQNTFANESFLDEIAAAGKLDPIAIRQKLIDKDPRGLEVLDRLIKLSKWERRPSPGPAQTGPIARGRGMSYVKYELVRTYVGAVAEIEVERSTGRIRTTRFYVVHDCGQIINPDGLRNQIEGCVIQTVSRTLLEEVTFNRSHVTSVDWDSYPILRFPDVPEIVMDLIDRPTDPPWGAGEPAAAVIPSAIANALFDATGVRLRSVPFKPEKVKAALQQQAS